MQYRNPVPATAAVVTDLQDRILLVKRGVPPKVGEWCLPGGYIELDEEAHDSCCRELFEETALTGRDPELIGVYHSESPFYHSVLVSAFRFRVDDISVLQPGDDSTECCFFPADQMPPLAFHSHRQAITAFLSASRAGDRRIYGPWGAYLISSGDALPLVEAAINGGVRVVQLRDKLTDKGALYRVAMDLRRMTTAAGAMLIINDHVDLAMAVSADGVHIGQGDLPIEAVRAILPSQFLIGVSTHTRDQAMDAVVRGADYIGCGPLFATPTKAHYQPVGLELLSWAVQNIRVPVVAIGGINMENIDRVKKAGAQNVAMVRALAEDTAARVAELNRMLLG